MYTLNCKGKLIIIDQPLVMGIINATPDSFVEGHLTAGIDAILKLAAGMIDAGADILDIGGQSTRPGSIRVAPNEEAERVIPVIEQIHHGFPDTIISVDTYHSEVARLAVNAGASIVNDISGGEMDPAMIPTVASLKVPYICMHMQGTPETMQTAPTYQDIVLEILDYFIKKLDDCRRAGIVDTIIDPGFGFGITTAHNFTLLKDLHRFKMLGKPILVGLSRKKTICQTLGIKPSEALNGTTVLNTLAIQNSADILRVHDVKEAKQVVSLLNAFNYKQSL